MLVAAALMWSIAGVVSRFLESAARFEVTFWRSAFTVLALVPVMLWLIASLVFLLLRVAPGDPIDALLGLRAPPEARALLRQQLGLDQPLLVQYGRYLVDLLHGQLGDSLTNNEPVTTVIARRGISKSIWRRLCSQAPRTTMESLWEIFGMSSQLHSAPTRAR